MLAHALALTTLTLAAAAPRLEAAVAVGAGYDSNLNNAAGPSAAVGSGFTALRASGGASLDVGEATSLYGGLRLELERYQDVSDLTTGRAGLEAALVQELGRKWSITLAPSAAAIRVGDSARDATLLAAQATLRVKPVRDLALRAFYGHTSRQARDAVFSAERDRLGGSVEWRVSEGSYLTLAYAVERGDEVFYRSTSGGSVPMMGGRMVSLFGRNEEAFRAPATSQLFTPSLELGLGGGVHLLASYDLRLVRSDVADFPTHSVFVGLGVRR